MTANRLIILLLLAKFVVSSLLILFSGIGLSPDEAQYWTWSQELDWGYYSKPPAIAWQIWLTTALLGHNEFGVRVGAAILSFFLAFVIYRFSEKCDFSEKIAFWAAVALAFSPLGIFFSFAATTDGGSILFFTLAVAEIAVGMRKENPNYLRCGLWILCGALFKWTAYVFWIFVLLFLPFVPALRKKSLLSGILISAVALLPSIYWNYSHEWATFRHVFSTVVQPANARSVGGNFLDFLGAQIGLLSPIYFLLLLYGLWLVYRKRNDRVILFTAAFPSAVLVYLFLSLFKKIQPNWAIYLYPPGMLALSWGAYEGLKRGRTWLHIGTWLSIVLSLGAIAIPAIQSHNILPQFKIPYRANPFRQDLGWENLAPALKEAGYDPDKHFLFSDKYQIASILSFYAPGQKRAYVFPITHQRKNQFSYWPTMQTQEVGKTGFFVISENTNDLNKDLSWYEEHYSKLLAPYFYKIKIIKSAPLFVAYGKPVKFILIFQCTDYQGNYPHEWDKF